MHWIKINVFLCGTIQGAQVKKASGANNVQCETSNIQEEPIELTDESEIINEVDENVTSENEVEEPKQEIVKTVKYKNKEIQIPKAQISTVNSAEDSHKSKTGGEKISSEEAVKQHENDGQSVGIDVSEWQGNINWNKVKASGIEFAIIEESRYV